MSRRARYCLFLVFAGALLCANAGIVAAVSAQAAKHSAGRSRADVQVLRLDQTADRAFVTVVETRASRSSDRSPQVLGFLTAPAGARHPWTQRFATVATTRVPERTGGPALGSRAPPLPTA